MYVRMYVYARRRAYRPLKNTESWPQRKDEHRMYVCMYTHYAPCPLINTEIRPQRKDEHFTTSVEVFFEFERKAHEKTELFNVCHIRVCVCMYVCMCVYIYIYIHKFERKAHEKTEVFNVCI